MNITFTEKAIETITAQHGGEIKLKLVYDSEGCGCAVSGVPALWHIDELQADDIPATVNSFQVYYEQRQAVFFEEELIIDYMPATRSYRLKSRQQIYNDGMSILDKR